VVHCCNEAGPTGNALRDTGLFESIATVLVMNVRQIEGREATPSAGVIDSQER
jgi:hypothetical protein